MLIKLLVSVFERAKSKLTSTRSSGRISPDSDNEVNEFNLNSSKQISSSGPSIIHQQPRSSLSKWLCTTPASVDKSILSTKSNRVRRSSSWRSLKERGSNYIGHFTSRTLSVDELHRNDKHSQKNNCLHKQEENKRRDLSHSPMVILSHSRQKASGINSIRLSNCDDPTSHKRFDRLSSNFVNYSDINKKQNLSTKSHRRNNQQIFSTLSRNNTSSGGGDSGYSEESFATTAISSHVRPLHTSCPHCHCEQRSSFNNYKKLIQNFSNESSTSDTTINKETKSPDFYYRLFQQKQSLSASRSYPHIKPLPKTTAQSQTIKPSTQQQQRRSRTVAAKRRRHLSCDSSLWARTQTQQPTNLTSSPIVPQSDYAPLQRHFTTIGMIHHDPSSTYSKNLSPLPKNTQVFGELNLDAIELDSLRTLDCHRASFSSSYLSSSTSTSSSSINTDKHSKNSRHHRQKTNSRRKGTYLVWHEYKNSSLLSKTNGTNIFSVIRGDQVRLLRRIGKSTLLVQKEDDGSIGFLPQSCLAHDQINSFLSVKGLRETVL